MSVERTIYSPICEVLCESIRNDYINANWKITKFICEQFPTVTAFIAHTSKGNQNHIIIATFEFDIAVAEFVKPYFAKSAEEFGATLVFAIISKDADKVTYCNCDNMSEIKL